jgi:quercetin dioxygenase-like cupin family protein
MSTSSQPNLETGGVILPITEGEPLLRTVEREGSILLAREQITITHARYAAGQQVAGPHIHHHHTDAFYVLEGSLTFEIGCEARTITVSQGGFIAAPPEVAHSFRTDGDRPARWLTIHAQDGGFATFMRGLRDGIEVEWDISKVPTTGGLAASEAIVSPDVGDESPAGRNPRCRLRCALPDMRVVEWQLHERHLNLPLPHHDHQLVSFFVIEGELEATLAATTQCRPRHADLAAGRRAAHDHLPRAQAGTDAEPPHARGRIADDLLHGSETRREFADQRRLAGGALPRYWALLPLPRDGVVKRPAERTDERLLSVEVRRRHASRPFMRGPEAVGLRPSQ